MGNSLNLDHPNNCFIAPARQPGCTAPASAWRVGLAIVLIGTMAWARAQAAAPEPSVEHGEKAQASLDAPLPPGTVVKRTLADDPRFEFFVYVPKRLDPGPPMFIAVHGTTRNAREQAQRYASLAEEYGVVLVAPQCTAARFPDYERLGREGRGERADQMLERVIVDVARTTKAVGEKVYLFGDAGGGQFVHRFAMAHPEKVAAYVVGATGSYTFPDPRLPYPEGIKPSASLPDVRFDPVKFLAVRGAVVVEGHDAHPGTALRKAGSAGQQKKDSHFERGERWVAAMNGQAQAHGLLAHFTFHEIPPSPHSSTKVAQPGDMDHWVFQRLFGD